MTELGKLWLPKLKGKENFPTWKQSLVFVLDSLDLWPYVTGQKPPPVDPDVQSTTPTTDQQAIYDELLLRYEKWVQNNARACMIIRKSAPSPLLDQLEGTAKDLYDSLCECYDDNDRLVLQQPILQQWSTMSLKEDEDVVKYVERWTKALRTCLRAKIDVKSDHLQVIFFVTSIAVSKRYPCWADNILLRLLQCETWSLESVMADLVCHSLHRNQQHA